MYVHVLFFDCFGLVLLRCLHLCEVPAGRACVKGRGDAGCLGPIMAEPPGVDVHKSH